MREITARSLILALSHWKAIVILYFVLFLVPMGVLIVTVMFIVRLRVYVKIEFKGKIIAKIKGYDHSQDHSQDHR